MTRSRQLLLSSAAIALLASVPYASIGSHEFLLLDDESFVTGDPAVQGGLPAALRDIAEVRCGVFWQPVTALSLATTRSLFGLDARGFHFENVAWHAGCAILVLLLLATVTGQLARAFAAAALFAVHPVHVEAVAWALERKTLVAAFFGLAAALAYVSWTRRGGVARMVVVLALAALSMLAKPSVVALPGLLVALDVWPLRRFWEAPLRRLLEKLPVALVCGALAVVIASTTTVPESEGRPLALRLANALVSVFQHLGHLAWPSGLAVYYPFPDTIPAVTVALALAASAGVSFAAVKLRTRAPYLLAGWAWFVLALLPTLGVIQPGRWPGYADRYAYVPAIGLAFVVAWGVADLAGRARGAAPALGAIAVLALAAVTARQLTFWRDTVSLFARAVTFAPESGYVHYIYGTALARAGRADEGIAHLATAVRLEPTPLAYGNLAAALADQGRYEESAAAALAALRLDPNDAEAHYNLGRAYSFTARYDEAVAEYRSTLARTPHLGALTNLGGALNRLGRFDETVATLEREGSVAALPEARFNLGVAYAALRDPRAARELAALRALSPPLAGRLEAFIAQTGGGGAAAP
jgi:Tfp pilus assembly protein PilF